jgi:hypothetical protein
VSTSRAFVSEPLAEGGLGDEERRLKAFFLWAFLVEVIPAIAQLFVMDVGRLSPLVGQFFYIGQLLALALRLLDASEHFLSGLRVLVQVIVQALPMKSFIQVRRLGPSGLMRSEPRRVLVCDSRPALRCER